MFENLGGAELLLVFLVILIFFGPKKIPELAASFGKGLRKFREAKAGMEEQFRTALKEPVEEMRKAQQHFNKELNAAQKGFEKKVQEAMNEETASMRDAGEAVKSQIEEAVKSLEAQQKIPTFTSAPNEYVSSNVNEAVPGGVKIHKLI